MGTFELGFALFAALATLTASAESPNWYCKDVASERTGLVINSCGIGLGKSESDARAAAFEKAREEFYRICHLSDDCNQHKISVDPKRTTCESQKGGYQCYRLIEFTIGPKSENTSRASKADDSATLSEGPEVFKSFVYAQIAANPKVYRGMTKAELLDKFGAPHSIEKGAFSENEIQYFYKGKMCVYDGICYVIVTKDRVTSFSDFKPIFTDLLK